MALVSLSDLGVVVLDLDDTLYSERQYAFSGFDAVSDWLSSRMACGFDVASRMRELFDTEDRGHVFDAILKEMSCDSIETMVPQMVACYRAHRPSIELHSDAAKCLHQWKDIFQLALISDGPLVMQERKVEALGLARLFDLIVLTDQWGRQYWKPHPRAFQEVEKWSGESGNRCLYIADNASKDFLAPRALGWQTVWLRRPGGLYRENQPPDDGQAEYTVSSLGELILSL